MKADKYIASGAVGIWRYRQREGPPICYIVRKDTTTRGFSTAAEAIKYIGWPKNLPTGQAIREWFAQFTEDDANAVAKPLDDFHQQIAVEGFGPEAHEPDPVADTKMVT